MELLGVAAGVRGGPVAWAGLNVSATPPPPPPTMTALQIPEEFLRETSLSEQARRCLQSLGGRSRRRLGAAHRKRPPSEPFSAAGLAKPPPAAAAAAAVPHPPSEEPVEFAFHAGEVTLLCGEAGEQVVVVRRAPAGSGVVVLEGRVARAAGGGVGVGRATRLQRRMAVFTVASRCGGGGLVLATASGSHALSVCAPRPVEAFYPVLRQLLNAAGVVHNLGFVPPARVGGWTRQVHPGGLAYWHEADTNTSTWREPALQGVQGASAPPIEEGLQAGRQARVPAFERRRE